LRTAWRRTALATLRVAPAHRDLPGVIHGDHGGNVSRPDALAAAFVQIEPRNRRLEQLEGRDLIPLRDGIERTSDLLEETLLLDAGTEPRELRDGIFAPYLSEHEHAGVRDFVAHTRGPSDNVAEKTRAKR